jgi:hypothetical protein
MLILPMIKTLLFAIKKSMIISSVAQVAETPSPSHCLIPFLVLGLLNMMMIIKNNYLVVQMEKEKT